jgi:type II secretory pathway pseudopilin PulG
MKLPIANCRLPIEAPRTPERGLAQAGRAALPGRSGEQRMVGSADRQVGPAGQIGNQGAFTMIEIALCLAIIGFALLSILLVLPSGMNTQRDTRQETIIGQDASVLLEAIRGGARGMDELTNYVDAITNYYQDYDNVGQPSSPVYVAGYTYTNASVNYIPAPSMVLTNGLRIVGLLSTPEFTDGPEGTPLSDTFGRTYTSNHIVAYVRSISGLAAEKPPQNNDIMRSDTFTYRLLCVNAPMAADTNSVWGDSPAYSAYNHELAANLRELRLMFMWPQLPDGHVGNFRQTFRATIAGQLTVTNYYQLFPGIDPLYFYEPQSFTNAP